MKVLPEIPGIVRPEIPIISTGGPLPIDVSENKNDQGQSKLHTVWQQILARVDHIPVIEDFWTEHEPPKKITFASMICFRSIQVFNIALIVISLYVIGAVSNDAAIHVEDETKNPSTTVSINKQTQLNLPQFVFCTEAADVIIELCALTQSVRKGNYMCYKASTMESASDDGAGNCPTGYTQDAGNDLDGNLFSYPGYNCKADVKLLGPEMGTGTANQDGWCYSVNGPADGPYKPYKAYRSGDANGLTIVISLPTTSTSTTGFALSEDVW